VLSLPASDPSAVGEVRRSVDRAGRLAGLDEESLARLKLVCTEATENLVRHGGGGEVLVGIRTIEGRPTVELIALDRGPGIEDIAAALVDGHSGAGTAGCGLGALQRLSDGFDLHSVVGAGTALLSRVRSRTTPAPLAARAGQAGQAVLDVLDVLDVGAVRVAYPGEHRCGDAWRARAEPGAHALCLVDGLGHGDAAADAAEAALRGFDEGAGTGPAARLALMSAASHGTRGSVGSVVTCRVPAGGNELALEHAGIGNVSTAVHGPGRRPGELPTTAGTLGREDLVARTGRGTLGRDGLIIMHSDGLALPDPFARRDGLVRRDPTLIAAVLYRDGTTRRDDCAVLVARPASTTVASRTVARS